MDDSSVIKNGNGLHAKNGSKNRLRIQGTATLERSDQDKITASYDYTTSCANAFFEEDVDQLKCFELNKIALGMTIHRKDENKEAKSLRNGSPNKLVEKNGSSSPLSSSLTMLHSQTNGTRIGKEPSFLTDVIWSRMDMVNPKGGNPTAYIIKQYYKNGQGATRVVDTEKNLITSHAEKCDNFLCGFLSCAVLLALGCAFAILYSNPNSLDYLYPK